MSENTAWTDVIEAIRLDRAREDVIRGVLNYVQARLYMEAHPEDPHGGDSVDLASDHLDEMLSEWASLQHPPEQKTT